MFREKIRGVMNERRIGVNDLARKTGINRNSISSFLSGSRAISNANLDKILDVLGLTLVPKAKFSWPSKEEKQRQNQE